MGASIYRERSPRSLFRPRVTVTPSSSEGLPANPSEVAQGRPSGAAVVHVGAPAMVALGPDRYAKESREFWRKFSTGGGSGGTVALAHSPAAADPRRCRPVPANQVMPHEYTSFEARDEPLSSAHDES